MVNFNVTMFNTLNSMGYLSINDKLIYMNNIIFDRTVTKLFTILKKGFLPNLNPTSFIH